MRRLVQGECAASRQFLAFCIPSPHRHAVHMPSSLPLSFQVAVDCKVLDGDGPSAVPLGAAGRGGAGRAARSKKECQTLEVVRLLLKE